ncbi:MAG: sigma-70 family RNA polymerase sigma factor [bacterium]
MDSLSKVQETQPLATDVAPQPCAMPADEEKRLIARAQEGDRDAMNDLILHYQDRVYNLAYRLVGDHDEASDLSQEVFLTLFRKLKSFRKESRLGTWLYRIVVNHAKNRWKFLERRGRSRTESLEASVEDCDHRAIEVPDRAPDPRQQAAGREEMKLLGEHLGALQPEFREVLVLRFVENLSYEEIADVLETKIGTVKSRINRGRELLRERMRDVLKARRG